MAKSFVLDVNPGNIITSVHEEDDELIFTDVMPGETVKQILDDNERIRQEGLSKTGPSGLGTIGARIPLPTWTAWQKEWSETYKPYMKWNVFLKRRLNDPDYKNFVFQRL